jgi:hypothetical protein
MNPISRKVYAPPRFSEVLPICNTDHFLFVEEGMDQLNRPIRPYALKAGEGWTYRFGIDFTVKVSEIQEGSGVAFL